MTRARLSVSGAASARVSTAKSTLGNAPSPLGSGPQATTRTESSRSACSPPADRPATAAIQVSSLPRSMRRILVSERLSRVSRAPDWGVRPYSPLTATACQCTCRTESPRGRVCTIPPLVISWTESRVWTRHPGEGTTVEVLQDSPSVGEWRVMREDTPTWILASAGMTREDK